MVAEVLGKRLFMAIRSRNAGVDGYLRNVKTPFRYSYIQGYTKDKEPEMPEPDMTRAVLPIPDRPHIGLTTYDAKDPNTKFPAIEPLRPRKMRPTYWSSCWMTLASQQQAPSVDRAKRRISKSSPPAA
jgi:hypothetical protein